MLRSVRLGVAVAVLVTSLGSGVAWSKAIIGTAGGADKAIIFPSPETGLPNPVQTAVTGLPSDASPHGVDYFEKDRALIADFNHSRVFVIQISTATRVATINTAPHYKGMGTISVAPDHRTALAMGGSEKLTVIRAPFDENAQIWTVALPGQIASYQTQGIVFSKSGRAFVYHKEGISVLDPPYTSLAFTIPVEDNSDSGAIAITPDGKKLLVTNCTQTVEIFSAPYSAGSTPVRLRVQGAEALDGIMVTPDGTKALVVDGYEAKLFAISSPFTSTSYVERIPLPEIDWGSGFEDVGISHDGKVAILTGNDEGQCEYAPFIEAPFTAAGARTHAVFIAGGRGAGSVRFPPAELEQPGPEPSPPIRKPDLQIKKGAEPESRYALNNVYQSTSEGDQIERQSVLRGQTATYHVKVENDGSTPEEFVLRARENATAGWTVAYRVGTTAITSQIRGAGYTARLPAGGSAIITIEVTASTSFGLRPKSTVVRVFQNSSDTTARDAVEAITCVTPDIGAMFTIVPNPGPVGGMMTARISVTRTAYTDGFRIDFYRDRDVSPIAGDQGDNVVQVEAGADAVVKEIRFRPTTRGDFLAWCWLDSGNAIGETNENNNVLSAGYTVETLSISGSVRNDAGQGFGGVVVSAMSPSTRGTVKTATTNASGDYIITGLAPAQYTVFPSRSGLVFDPPVRSVTLTVTDPDASGVDFTGRGVDISASLEISRATSPLGTVLTAIITVTRSAATPGFWVDLYLNRATAPTPRSFGDRYFYVPAGDASVVYRIKFTPRVAGTFRAWVYADTDGYVSEINEANNIAGPVTYTVTVGSLGISGKSVPLPGTLAEARPPEISQ